ncbi:MAG: spondin domain-containing protein [Actinomycetota bacterium]
MQRVLRALIGALALTAVVAVTTPAGATTVEPPAPEIAAEAAALADPASGGVRYTITVENLTRGQYLTPPNWAVHDVEASVFERRRPASPGLQSLAENGGVADLAAELTAAIDEAGRGTSGVAGDTPIEPGARRTFDVTTTADRLSLAAMLVCTNDGFAGLDGQGLPRYDGHSRTYYLPAYDAGTEINTEARTDLVPAPFCGPGDGSTMSNPDLAEGGVVRLHRTIQGTGDLGPEFDWARRVAKVTVTRDSAPATYEVTIENLTDRQYLTPPNWAAHSSAIDVFSMRRPASPALAGLAENGDVATMAAALTADIDEPDLGRSGVAGDTPIEPGGSRTFTITTSQRRLSFTSMLICTNDGFAGLRSRILPFTGGSRVISVRAYDAGSEINTEARADLVPAPFCGEGEGSASSDPTLAENGVVTLHPTIEGVGDLGPEFDWQGRVAVVTVTKLD